MTRNKRSTQKCVVLRKKNWDYASGVTPSNSLTFSKTKIFSKITLAKTAVVLRLFRDIEYRFNKILHASHNFLVFKRQPEWHDSLETREAVGEVA